MDLQYGEGLPKTKSLLSEDTLLVYPQYRKEFVVQMDSSDYQLGSVVSQERRPIMFFSQKLTQAQRKYTTTEKKLLEIAETIKQFRKILYRQKVVALTNHKKITYNTTNHASNSVLHQKLLLKEYGVEFCYIKGVKKVVVNSLSRLALVS